MRRHPNKHIQAAIDYALDRGWRLQLAGPRAHIWGQLLCPDAQRGGMYPTNLLHTASAGTTRA